MLSSVFIDRPRLAFVISIVITLAGLIAIGAIPLAQFPDIVPPQVQVTGDLPRRQRRRRRADGGAADRAAGQRRRQDALHEVDLGHGRQLHAHRHLRSSAPTPTSTRSTSRTGSTSPCPQLPDEVSRQGLTIKKVSSALLQVVRPVLAEGHATTRCSCRNYATINMIDALKRVHGVGDAAMFGPLDYSMRVWLDPQKHGQPRDGAGRRSSTRSSRRTRRRRSAASARRPSPRTSSSSSPSTPRAG